MTDATNMTMVGNEGMFDNELKWFFFSEKERACICQVLVEENQTGKVCAVQVKMLMDGKRVKNQPQA